MLMDPRINSLLEELQDNCSETTQLSIRYGVNTGDFLIQPTLKTPKVTSATGQTHYTESLRDRSFRVASPSFFQVNVAQLDRMVDLIREALQLTGTETVMDAYAGVGTFALLLAPFAGKIIAIEDSVNAVEDARANAQGTLNVEFLLGRTEKVLADLEETPHGVILDPSRKGCHPDALEALARLAPTRLVYVSCDPGTLARDLKILCQGPFYLVGVQPLDMFPQTHHVECIATLALRRPLQDLVLASTSPRRRQLAESLGLDFNVVAPHVEETHQEEDPKAMVQRLALAKAQKVAADRQGPVVGADTTVVLDSQALGKPSSVEEATEMLQHLRGREHRVLTAVALVDSSSGKVWQETCESTVAMRDYSDSEIEAYVASGKAMDKAGAYGVQDEAFSPSQHVEGCYSNVVGLPLCTLAGLLDRAGYKVQGLSLPDKCQSHILGEEGAP
jgi:23S rRNA (uracil1939-C5)-methyltransferase